MVDLLPKLSLPSQHPRLGIHPEPSSDSCKARERHRALVQRVSPVPDLLMMLAAWGRVSKGETIMWPPSRQSWSLATGVYVL